jgi:uncharacterized protein
MRGMSSLTGKAIDGSEHLRQSVADILTTPLGSRVMRRPYGSLLFELVDQPFNPLTRLRLFAASAVALARWEQRLKLTKVSALRDPVTRRVTLVVEGARTDLPAKSAYVRLTIPLATTSAGSLTPVLN